MVSLSVWAVPIKALPSWSFSCTWGLLWLERSLGGVRHRGEVRGRGADQWGGLLTHWSPGDMVSNLNVRLLTSYNSPWLEMPWWHDRTWSALGQVMAFCLMTPSHYPDQCWLIMSEVLCHSHENNLTENAQYMYLWYEFDNNQFMITATSVWVAFLSLSTKGF